jgi:hypothetical protein
LKLPILIILNISLAVGLTAEELTMDQGWLGIADGLGIDIEMHKNSWLKILAVYLDEHKVMPHVLINWQEFYEGGNITPFYRFLFPVSSFEYIGGNSMVKGMTYIGIHYSIHHKNGRVF